MIANYHTHTWRCNHATGTEVEYVETAIRAGYRTLGFSDHVPYVFDGDYYSTFRMQLRDAEDYVRTVLDLRDAYAGQMEILLGFEAEYYPGLFDRLMRYLDAYPIDYYILGQHFTGCEQGELYAARPSVDEGRLTRYVDQVLTALGTGRFLYVAHPDILNFTGPRDIYRREMRRLCEGAKARGVPLEFNALGYMDGRNYPNEDFWREAGEAHCSMIFGCDAHRPEHVCRPEAEAAARRMAERYGLPFLEELEVPVRERK